MTNKEIIYKIVNTEKFKEKYSITEDNLTVLMQTRGMRGMDVLKMLYKIVEGNKGNVSTNNTYKIIKTIFKI